MGYKCICCRKEFCDGGNVYFIEFRHRFPEPVCSLKCVEKLKANHIKNLKREIEDIEKMEPVKEKW